MHTSKCTSTIETAVYENRTYGGVRGRRLVTASYSIPGLTDLFLKQVRQLAGEREKPSVREKLQKAPAAPRCSVPARKKEAER